MALNAKLAWTPVITGAVDCQTASKRKKSVGGAFDYTGFYLTDGVTPVDATCFSNLVTELLTEMLPNLVYEFKIENDCSDDTTTINNNGIIEFLKFSCILPAITINENTANVNVNLAGTDITKVKYTVKLQADSSTVDTQTVVRVSDNAPHTFTLDDVTNYYLEIELYADVNGGEVISSNVAYLGAVCGGNFTGYKFKTLTAIVTCTQYINNEDVVLTIDYTNCADEELTAQEIFPGQIVCIKDESDISGIGDMTNLGTDCI